MSSFGALIGVLSVIALLIGIGVSIVYREEGVKGREEKSGEYLGCERIESMNSG
jgi:hypothetical protein